MLRGSRDDFICDMAETYHVLDYRALPVGTLSVLAAGLPDGSRSKRRLSGAKLTREEWLLALLCDSVRAVDWHICGGKKKHQPQSILELLTKDEENDVEAFDDADEFERWHRQMMR